MQLFTLAQIPVMILEGNAAKSLAVSTQRPYPHPVHTSVL